MPPKRAAPANSGAAPKKSRSSNSNDSDSQQPTITRSKRWAKVSGSGNLDDDYKLAVQNPIEAYGYVCLCQPPFTDTDGESKEENDDGWEDGEDEWQDDDSDKGAKQRSRCDGGEACICGKPADEHPDHPWKLTHAARHKFFNQRTHCDLRNPDNFRMYTYNDHAGYGALESVENLVLDYEDAQGNWKEQWVLCETLAYFIPTFHASMMFRIDDSRRATDMCVLLGRLFLATLARLEREGLLAKNSGVKSLGTVMGLWIKAANEFRGYSCLDSHQKESLGPKKDKKTWVASSFDSHILAYAKKYEIKLSGPRNIESLIEECEEEVDLPVLESNNAPKADPFNYAQHLKKYKAEFGPEIGGDSLDITTMSSAERKKASSDKKDPLGKREMDSIKKGMVMQVG